MISYIVPTSGRHSLVATLQSIECWPGDEILVIGQFHPTGDERPRYFPCGNGNDWGAKERNIGIEHAQGQYLAFMDDDDTYAPGARDAMERVIVETPDRPAIFRMRYPNGMTLWQDPNLRCGNVSTQMIMVPNVPTMLAMWPPRYEGDFLFLDGMKWPKDQIVWNREIIALIGHDVVIPSAI
jgi:hypothetical protein